MSKSKAEKLEAVKRVAFSVFGVLIVAFVLFHTFGSLFVKKYATEVAAQTSVSKTISSECYIVRKENIIESDYTGHKVCKVSNGGKVAKNSTVVSFYENAADVEIANEIHTLEEFLAEVTEIDKQNSILVADLDIISNQTSMYIQDLLKNVNDNNFSEAQKNLKYLRYYMAQGQLATGREDNYKSVIKSCKSKLSKLKSQYSSSEKNVISEYSGYFVNFTDGYENSLSFENIEDVTVDDINGIKPAQITDNQVGKVITENEWYIVTVVNTNDIKDIDVGDNITISTMLSTVNELRVKVEAVNKNEDGTKSALVLSCMKMNEELASLRHKKMQIVLKTYKGLKVNSRAIRIKDGEKGVYVKRGRLVKFVKTNIIYNTKDYVIVESENSGGELRIYDDVIVEGKDLDG